MQAITKKNDHHRSITKHLFRKFGLLLGLVLLILFTSEQRGNAQEVRANAQAIITGSGAALPGFGLGAEAPIGKLFSVGVDVNYGMHRIGSAIMVKPSLNFYFSKKQTGIFIGPTLNYYSLINKKSANDERAPGTAMYGFGFNFGGKANLSDKLNMHVVLSPQGSIGPFNGVSLTANMQMGIGFKF